MTLRRVLVPTKATPQEVHAVRMLFAQALRSAERPGATREDGDRFLDALEVYITTLDQCEGKWYPRGMEWLYTNLETFKRWCLSPTAFLRRHLELTASYILHGETLGVVPLIKREKLVEDCVMLRVTVSSWWVSHVVSMGITPDAAARIICAKAATRNAEFLGNFLRTTRYYMPFDPNAPKCHAPDPTAWSILDNEQLATVLKLCIDCLPEATIISKAINDRLYERIEERFLGSHLVGEEARRSRELFGQLQLSVLG